MYRGPYDRAVQFGQTVDMGLGEENRAYPFVYNLVPGPEDRWEQDKSTDNLSGIGPVVPSGATVDYYLRTDKDYPFLALFLKYTVYWLSQGVYYWYDPVPGHFLEPFDYQTAIGTPLTHYLDVTLSIVVSQDRTIYGGYNTNPVQSGGRQVIPLPIRAVQGYDYGFGSIILPYLISNPATIRFRFTNRHTVKDLRVGAALYGKKVRV